MRIDEGVLADRKTKGPKLYAKEVLPDGPPCALIGVVHGYADHGARYAHVMEYLAEHDIGSVAIDLRGHGRAEGVRGHVDEFVEYTDDIAELAARLEQVATRAGATDVPRVLYGHSMGGVATFHAALRARAGTWDALAHTDPFFGLGLEVPWIKRAAANLAVKVYPKLAIPTGLAGKDLTHDAAIAQKYEADPLVFKTATAGWFTQVLAAQKEALTRAPEMKLPYWVCHGGADPIAKLAATRAVFERAGSSHKEWVDAPGLLHEVFNEPEWRPLVDQLIAFTKSLPKR